MLYWRPRITEGMVLRYHQKNPHLCAKEIAVDLGMSWATVRKIAYKRKLVLPSAFARRRLVTIRQPRK